MLSLVKHKTWRILIKKIEIKLVRLKKEQERKKPYEIYSSADHRVDKKHRKGVKMRTDTVKQTHIENGYTSHSI